MCPFVPTTVHPSETLKFTKVFAPILQLFPIVISPRQTAFAPIRQLLPILILPPPESDILTDATVFTYFTIGMKYNTY